MSVETHATKDTYGKSNPCLLCGRESKDVVVCPFINTFEDGKIGDDSSRVEILEAIEDQVVTIRNDAQIAVSWINST